ncbi:MAG: penicillin-binding transpeptidase domain-containing protein [Actinomycetota bacterium]|nr:penicillin-binding transpeptidase domain-containing protein [Actinomycetota bacterium]
MRRSRSARLTVRRRRLLTRAAPLGGAAALAFSAGVVSATGPGRAEHRLVTRYVSAWAYGDYASMYRLLDSGSRRRISERDLVAAYRGAASIATLDAVVPGRVGNRTGNFIAVRMRVRTSLFGTLPEVLQVPLSGSGSDASIHFSGALLFPGLRPGERLRRRVSMLPRGALLASDGTPLAQGSARASPIPDVASQVVGKLGAIAPAQAAAYAAEGFPRAAKVGADGLERTFQQRLAGKPGGTLLAGKRVLARASPSAGLPVTTTIDPTIERAAIKAMGQQYSGIVAMDPRTGALLALAGIAYSAPQPPGSTMKIITSTGALQAGITTLGETFPIMTGATIDGYTLQNASGEACGGTLLNAFAVSCNSVFAPLGAKLGARRLVNVAKRFGFDEPSSIPGAAESVIPSASTIGDALSVGSSAIGQGKVLSTPLEMTDAAATIAMGGRRPIPTLLARQPPRFYPVTSARIAGLVQEMMVAVVQFGTGTPAQIPGVQVAGKTGTAELRSTTASSSPQNTDSWFVGYAPVGVPRIVVGALFPAQGAGAATAAPAVREVLVAALHAH